MGLSKPTFINGQRALLNWAGTSFYRRIARYADLVISLRPGLESK